MKALLVLFLPGRNLQRQCVDDFQKAGYERQP